jgi:hypothetical protein
LDQHIARFDAVADRDLAFCVEQGVAYQIDMTSPIDYGQRYFEMYAAYEGQPVALMLNAARVRLVNRHAGAARGVLDIGIGSGEFISSRQKTFGWDVNPVAMTWLQDRGLAAADFAAFTAFTMWDVLEHVPTPADYFERMPNGSFLFVSMPIFDDLTRVRLSKHYKPNEHFYYFTEKGLVGWLARHGFVHLETNDDETRAGREAIKSFAFRLERG